jgi:hypothetical protein
MPFVLRNWKGEIRELYESLRFDPNAEHLPDDHPEIIAYYAKFPIEPPPTAEEFRKFEEMMHEDGVERMRIQNNVMQFHGAFSSLETALSTLLASILNITGSQLSYAIYYSPTSFDARAEIVNNALIQIATEQKHLADLLQHWKKIDEKIQEVRRLRNAIAHSSLLTFGSAKGKLYTRLSPPAFDVIRVGRKRANKQIPGLTSDDVWQGTKKTRWLSERIDDVSRLVFEFHDGNPSLREKYAQLEADLKVGHSPGSAGGSPVKTRPRPPRS